MDIGRKEHRSGITAHESDTRWSLENEDETKKSDGDARCYRMSVFCFIFFKNLPGWTCTNETEKEIAKTNRKKS